MRIIVRTWWYWRVHGLVVMALALGACSTVPNQRSGPGAVPRDIMAIPDAVPKVEPRSRYGNPATYVVFGRRYHVLPTSNGYVERGVASWYGPDFHGERTSSGDTYDMYGMTAAHKSLPLPTYARVTNLRNGRSIVVRINDRGPFVDNRIIDLSYTGAAKLGLIGSGTGLVEVRALDPRRPDLDPGPTLLMAQNTLPSKPAQAKSAAAAKPAPKLPKQIIDKLISPAYADDTPPSGNAPGANPPGPATPTLYLQIGAFSNRDNAEQLRSKLSAAHMPGIHISESVSNQRPIYRVRIGPLASVAEADRMASELGRYGIANPHVVID
ncbi:MAG: septal ring lytic transglycosylase RlpA family protein [Gammaproteobacteria bacterium]|nr:septal ring lytic transglycosylase RlpA family protein [Gammaproteobacteria bacterium]